MPEVKSVSDYSNFSGEQGKRAKGYWQFFEIISTPKWKITSLPIKARHTREKLLVSLRINKLRKRKEDYVPATEKFHNTVHIQDSRC
jgi:hypothetical protein